MADANMEGKKEEKELKVGGHSAVLRGQSVRLLLRDVFRECKI